MTPEVRKAGEELARRSRRKQGLHRRVRDRDAVARITALLVRKAAS